LHYKIILSDKANNDIDRITEYLKHFNYRIDRIIKKINDDMENLKYMPKMHKTIFYYTTPDFEYRRIVSAKYVVIYKIVKDEIIILRIFNQKENYLNQRNFILKEKSQKYIVSK